MAHHRDTSISSNTHFQPLMPCKHTLYLRVYVRVSCVLAMIFSAVSRACACSARVCARYAHSSLFFFFFFTTSRRVAACSPTPEVVCVG